MAAHVTSFDWIFMQPPLLKRMAGSCLIIWECLFLPRWRQESSDPCHLYDELCSKLSCWPKIGVVFLMPGRLNVIDFASVLFFADSGHKAFNRTVELCHSISMKSNWEWWASLDNFHGQWLMKCWLNTGSSNTDAELFHTSVMHFTIVLMSF